MNKDEAKKVFNTYHMGYDLAKIRDQLNVEEDVLNEAAAADNDDNETAVDNDDNETAAAPWEN